MLLLIQGANILFECPQQGCIVLANLFQVNWDNGCEQLREFACQEMLNANLDIGSVSILGRPLIVHALTSVCSYSEETVQWMLDHCFTNTSLDQQLLDSTLLSILNSKYMPDNFLSCDGCHWKNLNGDLVYDARRSFSWCISSARTLINLGASCLYSNDEHKYPVTVLLIDRQWDNYPGIRRSAIEQIKNSNCDVNSIRINGLLVMELVRNYGELGRSICYTTSGVYFLFDIGVIPLPIDINVPFNFQMHIDDWFSSDRLSAVEEIHEIQKQLSLKCGLKYEALIVILQNAGFVTDDTLHFYSTALSVHNPDSPPTDVRSLISDVKQQVVQCLKEIVIQRKAESTAAP